MKTPRLKGDWEGLQVVTLRELKTSMMVIPVGTECTVTRNYGGLDLTAERCKSCGVRIRVKKVPENYVRIIEQVGQ